MRAKEFIPEGTKGKLPKRVQQPSAGMHKFTDAERWNSDYKQYRLGLALACSDGEHKPEVDKESWVGRWKTAYPYTDMEQKMLELAYDAVEIEHEDLNHGNLHSEETESTYTVSPVANWNKHQVKKKKTK